MFMVIFMAAQPMLESVLEEKIERISEVLLGSVTPFQLMLGKLLGNVAGSLCIFVVYFVGGYGLATYKGWASLIPLDLAPWFVAYQILAVMFFSSIFMAVGASVNQLKEAQSLLLPVWLLLVSPMFVWVNAIREPTGQIATWMSFFPPATPMMMILRLSTEKPIPPWQPIAGLLLLLVATLLCLFVAGRVFRIGILWQGKTPRLGEVFRWAISG
jgi:ABC-2 type transport system permease protein